MIGDFPLSPDWSALDDYDGLLLFRALPLEEAAVRIGARLAYLATPYSRIAVDGRGRWDIARSIEAQARATAWAGRLARFGVSAVAPITMAADIIHHDHAAPGPARFDPLDASFWEGWCRPLLVASGCAVVPPIPGWDVSAGVWREVVATLGACRPVYLLGAG